MKILLVTDTWDNVNGVATTLKNTVNVLKSWKHDVFVIEPSQFKTIGAPGYNEVKLSWNIWKVGRIISQFNPDAIHIATEGPLGLAARWYCKVKRRSISHNTSYHTKFPEYFNQYFYIPVSIGYFIIRWFHKFSTKVLVTTESMRKELSSKGFEKLEVWSRGVDHDIFNPMRRTSNSNPYILCVSRVSQEKNLDKFCEIKGYRKILVGDGPYLNDLKKKYPDVEYVGYKYGKELAEYYANAECFVFPSVTDTFGIVMLESISCGTPIAAYPVTGPIDVIQQVVNGYMNHDLTYAIKDCMNIDRDLVHSSSKKYTWENCTETFFNNLTRIHHE